MIIAKQSTQTLGTTYNPTRCTLRQLRMHSPQMHKRSTAQLGTLHQARIQERGGQSGKAPIFRNSLKNPLMVGTLDGGALYTGLPLRCSGDLDYQQADG